VTGETAQTANGKAFSGEYRPLLASSVWDQATTRGGRPVQGILNGKAQFKSATNGVGDVSTAVGNAMLQSAVQNNSSSMANMGLAGLGFGLAMKLMSSAAKADADIRAWDNLPDGIYVTSVHMPAPNFKVSAAWLHKNAAMPLGATPVLQATPGKCSIVWTRSRPAAIVDAAPGIDAGVLAARANSTAAAAKDKLFRTTLMNEGVRATPVSQTVASR
jgi:hypothetical protein